MRLHSGFSAAGPTFRYLRALLVFPPHGQKHRLGLVGPLAPDECKNIGRRTWQRALVLIERHANVMGLFWHRGLQHEASEKSLPALWRSLIYRRCYDP